MHACGGVSKYQVAIEEVPKKEEKKQRMKTKRVGKCKSKRSSQPINPHHTRHTTHCGTKKRKTRAKKAIIFSPHARKSSNEVPIEVFVESHKLPPTLLSTTPPHESISIMFHIPFPITDVSSTKGVSLAGIENSCSTKIPPYGYSYQTK